MRVGSLVRWAVEGEDYNSVGIVIRVYQMDVGFVVKWSDGEEVEYLYCNSRVEGVEVIYA